QHGASTGGCALSCARRSSCCSSSSRSSSSKSWCCSTGRSRSTSTSSTSLLLLLLLLLLRAFLGASFQVHFASSFQILFADWSCWRKECAIRCGAAGCPWRCSAAAAAAAGEQHGGRTRRSWSCSIWRRATGCQWPRGWA
ncbi:hypothetical protein ETH_00040070, partial [Eimeria tenella]